MVFNRRGSSTVGSCGCSTENTTRLQVPRDWERHKFGAHARFSVGRRFLGAGSVPARIRKGLDQPAIASPTKPNGPYHHEHSLPAIADASYASVVRVRQLARTRSRHERGARECRWSPGFGHLGSPWQGSVSRNTKSRGSSGESAFRRTVEAATAAPALEADTACKPTNSR